MSNPLAWAETYLGSTVGQKILVALTGLGLVTFVVFHMIGNLKMFSGRESINAYAYFLKHELGALIWIARAGLLGIFLLHFTITIRLKLKSGAARPIGYVRQKTAQASPASTSMIYTGLVVGAFTVFHLAHYTFAWVHQVELPNGQTTNYLNLTDEKGHHDVYQMMIVGFQTWWIAAIYLVAQLLLFVHLSHGIASSLQTLGLVGKRFATAAKALGYAVAGTVFLGNAAIIFAVWTKYLDFPVK
jgi:succinate dehydrogenase / fumarate reductase cytochrome b subunit